MIVVENVSAKAILKDPTRWSEITKNNITNDGGIFRGLYSSVL